MQIEILDTTLRDGAQAEGISFSVQDKLNILKALDDFGVDFIEAGNPASNPKDLDFLEQAKRITLQNAALCAFGSTCRKGLLPQDDENLSALLQVQTPVVTIFGKAWDLHVRSVLSMELADYLNNIAMTVAFCKSAGRVVLFDAEHFFDGYDGNRAYAMSVIQTALAAGADRIVLCDTRGGTLPWTVSHIVGEVAREFSSAVIGVHLHDDIGCAVASSLMSVQSGATHIQGSFLGFGERCGNADLSVILPDLALKCGHAVKGNLPLLTLTANRIAEICNLRIRNNQPYIGKSAFAHKGGMHIDGVQKLKQSFEHIDPICVGNKRRYLASEMAGKTTVIAKAAGYAPFLTKHSPETKEILKMLKERERDGYQFESADASFELLIKKIVFSIPSHFKVLFYKTTDDFPAPAENATSAQQASAMVQVEVGGEIEIAASLGNGPVNALDLALRKALVRFYPMIQRVQLTDYKVRVLESNSTTAAKIRVLIESSDAKSVWTTVGVSTDIVEASFIALVDSLEYILVREDEDKQLNC